MNQKTKLFLNLILSFVVFFIIIYVTGIDKILEVLATVKLEFVLLALLVYVLVNLLMSTRIKIVLDSFGDKLTSSQIFPSNLAGMLASDFTPARIGYFFTAFSLSSRFKLPLEKTMIAIFGPQLFDFLIKVTSASILFVFLVDKLGAGNILVNIVVLLFVLIGVIGAGLAVFYPPFLNYFKFFEKFPFVPTIFAFLRKMHLHSEKVLSVKWPVIGVTFLSWFFKSLEWFILAKALSISIFDDLLLDLGFMMIFQAAITIIHFLPIPTLAGAGASEAGFAAILVVFGIPLATSITFGFLTRFIMIAVDIFSLPVLTGYLQTHNLEKSLGTLTKFKH
ncbi:MAG: lysylphosphatidylglycerol synthase transmembrane domain-containing protein [Candidatus Micrarchaeota archaeon]